MELPDGTILEIKNFLVKNANTIQKLATEHHKEWLGGEKFRSEIIEKYQVNHIKVVKELADHLKTEDIKKSVVVFKKLGKTMAVDSVKDGLTIEEATDGIIFLKQAVWESIKESGILDKLTTREFYN